MSSPLQMEFSFTERGFARYDFRDLNGDECSLQKSSMAGTLGSEELISAIWLGCEHETVHEKTGQPCGARMHLTQAQVASLLPVLLHFVMTGEVSDEPAYVAVPAVPPKPLTKG
jgi:hypothetical protein